MKFRKFTALVLSALLTASLFTGCGKSESEKVPGSTENDTAQTAQTAQTGQTEGNNEKPYAGVTINWISQGVGDNGWEGLTKPILEKFEEETGIHVNAQFYSFNDLFEVIETKSSSKSSDFDVMSVDVTYVSKYGTSGYLEPLDSFFTDEEKKEWTDAAYKAGCWDNVMYAAPENTSTQILWYNKTLLEEAGITVPENDAENRLTYEQVADLAKQGLAKLDPDGSKGLIGFDFQQVSRVYQMNMLPNSMGGANIGEDGFSVDGVINTDPWINSMTWYQNLVKDGIASKGYDADQLPEFFYAGKMLFMVGGTWTPTSMTSDDEIGYTYAPCFKGYEDKAATATGSWYFGVNSNSKQKEAAAEFVKYFTLGEGNDMWLDINGDMPCRVDKLNEIMADDSDYAEYLKIGAYEAQNTAVPRAVTPAFGEYSTILNLTWEDVRNGADIKESLDNAVSQINAATAAYK